MADEIVDEYSVKNRAVLGFGVAYLAEDFRAVKLLQMARKKIHLIHHIELLEAVEECLVRAK